MRRGRVWCGGEGNLFGDIYPSAWVASRSNTTTNTLLQHVTNTFAFWVDILSKKLTPCVPNNALLMTIFHCTVDKHLATCCTTLSVLCCMVLVLVLVLVWLPSAVDLRRFIHRYLAPAAAGPHQLLGPALPDFGFNGAECGRERGNWKPKQKSEHIFEAERHLRQVLRVVTLVCNWSKQSPHS